jgi:hypothetical protein
LLSIFNNTYVLADSCRESYELDQIILSAGSFKNKRPITRTVFILISFKSNNQQTVSTQVKLSQNHHPIQLILLHGESNAPLESENTLESDHVVQERLRQEEEMMQTRNSEELKNKHRVEVEREEEDRKVEEQMRVEEVRMLELEVRKKEDHRKQEAEEAARRTSDHGLRRQLEAKVMDAAVVKLELHNHEDSIEQVRASFSGQLTRLAKKESAVNESRNEWDGEDTIFKTAREEHELEVTSHSEALIAHDRIICQVKEEILVADKLAKIIAQEVVVEKSTDPQDIDDELRMVQAEVFLQLEAAADEASQGLAAAKASIDGLEEEISSIEERLPIL